MEEERRSNTAPTEAEESSETKPMDKLKGTETEDTHNAGSASDGGSRESSNDKKELQQQHEHQEAANALVANILVPVSSSSSSSSSLASAVSLLSSHAADKSNVDLVAAVATAAAAAAVAGVFPANGSKGNSGADATTKSSAAKLKGESQTDGSAGPTTQQFQKNSAFSSENETDPSSIAPSTFTTGVSGSDTPSSMNLNKGALRRGKWTIEEETYVARVIQDFNNGFLDAPPGTTLRTYLSEKLHCDPMRITKKFTGDHCIGKRVFHPAVKTATNSAQIEQAQRELEQLEMKWRQKLDSQRREATKKSGRHGLQLPPFVAGNASSQDVTRTASWLERVEAILHNPKDRSPNSQMEQVKELLSEGPVIQQTSTLIPKLVEGLVFKDADDIVSKRKVTEADFSRSSPLQSVSELDEFHEVKKPRRSRSSIDLTTHRASGDDAEALVGFINCVRKESIQRRERSYSHSL